jgi:Recombination directionality factor-like
MAIKGLSDRKLSFPEIGQIRKGAAKTDANKPGPDLDYFRVIFDEAEKDAEYIFRNVYKDKPQELNIFLPFDEIERMWDPFLEAYTAGRMVARSDGEYFLYLLDTKTGEILVKNGLHLKTKRPLPYIDGQQVGTYTNRKSGKEEPIFCKPVGRLKVIIPELARAAYLTVITGSYHDIANISAQLEAFKMLNGGRIAGIPLVLRRRPKRISTPNKDGTRVRRVKWLLSIEADPEWVKKRLMATEVLALPGNTETEEDVIETTGNLVEDDEWEPPIDSGNGIDNNDPGYTEVTEPKEEPGQKTERQPAKIERPYAPEVVKDRILEAVQHYEEEFKPKDKGEEDPEVLRSIVATNLTACFAGDPDSEDKRHTVLFYLFGEGSLKKLEFTQLVAVKRWLDAKPDSGGEWIPNKSSIQEAVAMEKAALQDEGQLELM